MGKIVRIKDKNKTVTIGSFDSKQEAMTARKEAEKKYYKEFSYNDSMEGDEEK